MISALYIHIPFCTSRCAYCDFATSACHDDALMDAYVDALCLQVRRAAKAGLLGGVKTIYIGGGTPTHLGAHRLNSLVYMISLSMNLEQVEEFTVEANPESLDARIVKDLYALGVGRMSIGAQSFDDAVLREYGRPHKAADIDAAVAALRERDMEFSLDLICGGPRQTLASWRDSVERVIASGAGHVSIYPLTVEDGTPLAARVEAGEWCGIDEDVEAQMMEAAEQLLTDAGFERYEVASYAKPGRASKHNTAYWTGVEYLGLGAAASSMMSAATWDACVAAGVFGDAADEYAKEAAAALEADGRIRVQACTDVREFCDSVGHPCWEAEVMSSREALLEDAMLAFRRSAGLGPALAARACAAEPALEGVVQDLEAEGLIAAAGEGRLVPTERGWLMGNEIFGAIWGLA